MLRSWARSSRVPPLPGSFCTSYLAMNPYFMFPAYQLVHPIEFLIDGVLGVAGDSCRLPSSSSYFGFVDAFSDAEVGRVGCNQPPADYSSGCLGWFVPGVLGVGYGNVRPSPERPDPSGRHGTPRGSEGRQRRRPAMLPAMRAASLAGPYSSGAMTGGALGGNGVHVAAGLYRQCWERTPWSGMGRPSPALSARR